MIDIASKTELPFLMESIRKTKKTISVTFVNPFSYRFIKKDRVDKFDFVFSDGAFLTFLNNTFQRKKVLRASFDYSSIAYDFFNFCVENKYGVALVGAKAKEIEVAVNNILTKHPKLNLIFYADGYFPSDESRLKCIRKISDNKIDIVIVGMGCPLQDDFVLDVVNEDNNVKCAITCGGFFTQTSIRQDYYLPIVKKLGLRWLQRIILHSHVRKKVMIDYPIFLFSYLVDLLKMKLR